MSEDRRDGENKVRDKKKQAVRMICTQNPGHIFMN